jgi:hypothetical protein
MYRPARVALLLLVAVTACQESAATITDPTDDGGTATLSFALPSLVCSEQGVNPSPFRVADALATLTPAHGTTNVTVWDSTTATVITLADAGSSVSGGGATVNGSIIAITTAGTYRVRGTLSNGQLVVNATSADTVRLVLEGVTIANSSDSPLLVNKAAHAIVLLANGSTNRLTDGTSFPTGVDQNAALFSKANLTIGGDGALQVTGRTNDGITGKDGLVILGGAVTVTAADDGIRGKDYLVVRGGQFTITSGGDGLKSDEEDDVSLGYVLLDAGTFSITAAGDGVHGESWTLLREAAMIMRAGGGRTATLAADASAKGLKASLGLIVDGGTATIDAADDGLHSDDRLVVNGGRLTVATADDGLHADGLLTINAGTITVTNSYEGIESSGANLEIRGGDIHVTSSDDGINLAGNGDRQPIGTHVMSIDAGRLVVDAGGDGVDANGAITMSGGCLFVHAPATGPNPAIDFDRTFSLSGGTIIAASGAGMAQAPTSTGTQAVVHLISSTSRAAGSSLGLVSSTDQLLASIAPKRSWQSLVITTPQMRSGTVYRLYSGGTISDADSDGVPDSGRYVGGTLLTSFSLSAVTSRLNF